MQTTDNVASQISLLAVLMLADGRKITADVVPGMYAFSVIRKEEKGGGTQMHIVLENLKEFFYLFNRIKLNSLTLNTHFC